MDNVYRIGAEAIWKYVVENDMLHLENGFDNVSIRMMYDSY